MNYQLVSMLTSSTFKVQLRHEHAQIPKRADEGSAGYDLTSVENIVIPPRNRAMIDTGISIAIPNDCYARVAPRSGLAAKYGIDVLAGVIDSSYRGHIKVILLNTSDMEYKVCVGDRIAQMIFEKIYTPMDLHVVETLDESSRGESGFGSSGK